MWLYIHFCYSGHFSFRQIQRLPREGEVILSNFTGNTRTKVEYCENKVSSLVVNKRVNIVVKSCVAMFWMMFFWLAINQVNTGSFPNESPQKIKQNATCMIDFLCGYCKLWKGTWSRFRELENHERNLKMIRETWYSVEEHKNHKRNLKFIRET